MELLSSTLCNSNLRIARARVCVCVCGFVGGGAAQRPISGGGEETERLLAVKSDSETPTPRLQEARLEITSQDSWLGVHAGRQIRPATIYLHVLPFV